MNDCTAIVSPHGTKIFSDVLENDFLINVNSKKYTIIDNI
jgi:hypothetical protein